MDYKELKNKSEKDLKELLEEKRDELRELRFKASERQLNKVTDIKIVKKTITRIMTALNNKKYEVEVKEEQQA